MSSSQKSAGSTHSKSSGSSSRDNTNCTITKLPSEDEFIADQTARYKAQKQFNEALLKRLGVDVDLYDARLNRIVTDILESSSSIPEGFLDMESK